MIYSHQCTLFCQGARFIGKLDRDDENRQMINILMHFLCYLEICPR